MPFSSPRNRVDSVWTLPRAVFASLSEAISAAPFGAWFFWGLNPQLKQWAIFGRLLRGFNRRESAQSVSGLFLCVLRFLL
jgi:hypothetical protein